MIDGNENLSDSNNSSAFPRRKTLGICAFVFCVIFAIVLMFLPPGIDKRLSGLMRLITEPSQSFARMCGRATRGILGGFPNEETKDEIVSLRAELAEYQANFENTKAEYAQMEAEMTILKNRLGIISSSNSLSLTLCQVAKRDAFSEYYDYIVIDKGSSDGIKAGYCVMNERGLVGVVQETGIASAKVLLATSRQFAMPCMVRERNVNGLLVGTGTENPREMSMLQPVPKIVVNSLDGILFDKVSQGDAVTVSATGELYGHGIVVGVVSAVKSSMAGAPELTIEPAANFSMLKYVFVVVGKESR